mgnify:CR=1 FL=1
MTIKAIAVKPKELKPGDLFSTAGQAYWDLADPFSIGQKVYIRWHGKIPEEEEDMTIYKIEIVKKK